MIDPKELRIGNWVHQIGGNDLQVITINEIGISGRGEINGWEDKDFDAIPLTPELLEKAGFGKDGFGHYCISLEAENLTSKIKATRVLYFAGDYLYVEEWPDKLPAIERSIITIWNKDVMKEFHLHSLQNLYYSLTGTELKVDI